MNETVVSDYTTFVFIDQEHTEDYITLIKEADLEYEER